jgi:hypothetical protein
VPEDQELEPEAGVRTSAIDEGIEEQTEDGIVESEKHDRASWQVGSPRSAGPASEFSGWRWDRSGDPGALLFGCGSSAGTSLGVRNEFIQVAGRVDATMFAVEMEGPIRLKVAVRT